MRFVEWVFSYIDTKAFMESFEKDLEKKEKK